MLRMPSNRSCPLSRHPCLWNPLNTRLYSPHPMMAENIPVSST